MTLTTVAVILAIAAAAFSVLALANTSSSERSTDTFAMGVFAGRERFTARGWRFRNIALACGVTALLTFVWQLVR